jgi:hypothetical protein
VFTITRAGQGKPLTVDYVVRLYCEQPGAWHPLPDSEGTYPIKEPREWVGRFAPHLERVLKALGSAAPLAGIVLGVAAHELHGQLRTDVGHMRALLKSVPRRVQMPKGVLGGVIDEAWDGSPHVWAETDADYRLLESRLAALDPTRYWGGLSRITTPEGQILFVCRDHYRSYHTHAPMPRIGA